MTITNKKRFTLIMIVFFLILLLFILWLVRLFHKEVLLDLSNSLPGIIGDEEVLLYYDKDEYLTLSQGDLVSIIQRNYLKDSYTISFEGRIGEVPKSSVLVYDFHPFEKYSLMVDVSEFNMRDNFSSSGDFAFFVINHGINYVYMRIGGRGYGEKGNMYYDSCTEDYMAICDFLKIPYGFYYLDEALNEEEILEEVQFVKSFLEEHPTKMNVLPLAIDLEFQEGAGRADDIWDERTDLLTQLIEEFEKEEISCILYANAKRANDYLASLDCDFWIARYPQDGIIPNSTFAEFINLEQSHSILRSLLDQNNTLRSNISSSKEFVNSYSGDFLDKIIGWQFTADGASQDGITEAIDLSIVNNAFFKKYLP